MTRSDRGPRGLHQRAGESEMTERPNTFKMDFSTFILSLNTSALIHLGDLPDPQSKQRTTNIEAAKHTIEILEIIKDKTTGNLSEEEGKLLDDVLYDLRMKYVKVASTPSREEAPKEEPKDKEEGEKKGDEDKG